MEASSSSKSKASQEGRLNHWFSISGAYEYTSQSSSDKPPCHNLLGGTIISEWVSFQNSNIDDEVHVLEAWWPLDSNGSDHCVVDHNSSKPVQRQVIKSLSYQIGFSFSQERTLVDRRFCFHPDHWQALCWYCIQEYVEEEFQCMFRKKKK